MRGVVASGVFRAGAKWFTPRENPSPGGGRVELSFSVIPAGAQRSAGTQCGAHDPLGPGSR